MKSCTITGIVVWRLVTKWRARIEGEEDRARGVDQMHW